MSTALVVEAGVSTIFAGAPGVTVNVAVAPVSPAALAVIVAPPTVVNAIEDALSPFGVRIYEQHLPPARILELIAEGDPGR